MAQRYFLRKIVIQGQELVKDNQKINERTDIYGRYGGDLGSR